VIREVFPWDEYVLARSSVGWPAEGEEEHDLFAGLRATERPSVSTPVSWEEIQATLRSGDPEQLRFEAGAVLDRVAERGDLFAPLLSLVQELPK